MDSYKTVIDQMRVRKKEGQCFMINRGLAKLEANYADGMSVVELGPGLGILTEELCRKAKRVVAIEKDARLFERLKGEMAYDNLELINKDFFDVDFGKLNAEMMVSNIPYALSSKVISWLSAMAIPALLCVQKEFAQHMCAKPSTHNYSRLSVESTLRFNIYHVRDVPPSDFYPQPRVNSSIIYLVPKKANIDERTDSIIRMLMNHKKKTVRNALLDSAKELKMDKEQIKEIVSAIGLDSSKVFQLDPEKILEIAKSFSKSLKP